MVRAFVAAVRISYLLAALIALTFIVPVTLRFVRGLTGENALSPQTAFAVLFAVTFLFLPARAVWRLLCKRDLVPETHLRERPVVATLVLLTGTSGSLLWLIVCWGLLTTLPAARDANFAAGVFFSLVLLAVAFLVGEIVLVGGRQSTPR